MKTPLDYSHIAKQCASHPVIGFGESTHGTHQFFETKVEVFKNLVRDYNYNTFFLESIDDHCEAINQYIKTGNGDLEALVNKLFYVYRTSELLSLFGWLRSNYKKYPVTIVGIDERKHIEDYSKSYDLQLVNLRDKRMARVVKNYISKHLEAMGMIWAHDAHIAAYLSPPEWSPAERHISMGENLRKWLGNKYFCVAQLFGSGYFNAALINESNEFDNSKLVQHFARKPSKYFWEKHFIKELLSPTFLEAPDFAGLVNSGEQYYQRTLGWGVKRSVMHDNGNVVLTDISRAYNALVFFPRTTASHLLATK